jgi:hypothetical protein
VAASCTSSLNLVEIRAIEFCTLRGRTASKVRNRVHDLFDDARLEAALPGPSASLSYLALRLCAFWSGAVSSARPSSLGLKPSARSRSGAMRSAGSASVRGRTAGNSPITAPYSS